MVVPIIFRNTLWFMLIQKGADWKAKATIYFLKREEVNGEVKGKHVTLQIIFVISCLEQLVSN